MTGAEPSVAAVVVSWNCRDLLQECLLRLRRHLPAGAQIVVVDNGSSDGTAEMVRSRQPAVELIVNPSNLGYTRANNQGIRACRAEYLLLINADALLQDPISPLLEFAAGRERLGAIGPRLQYADGSWQRWTAGSSPGVRSVLYHHLFLERLPWSPAARGLYLARDVGRPFQPDWVSSACMLVSAEALAEVGLMDESLFTYMDDVDLCARLKAAGREVWYFPGLTVTHLMGGAASRGRASEAALRSFNRYFAASHGRPAQVAIRAIEFAGFVLRVLLYSAAGAARRSDPGLWAMARAHWTHVKLVCSDS